MDRQQLLDFDELAQAQREQSYPATITLGELTVSCAGGNFRVVGQSFGRGGRVDEYDLVFRVRKSLLAGQLPAVGSMLGFGSRLYRIDRAMDPPTSVAFVLYCVAPAKP